MRESEVSIEIAPESYQEVLALHRWLRSIDHISVDLLRSRGEIGEQGDAWDAIKVACASGGVAVAVVQAVKTWLESRRSTVTIRLRGKDRDLEVIVTNIEDPSELVAKVLGDG